MLRDKPYFDAATARLTATRLQFVLDFPRFIELLLS